MTHFPQSNVNGRSPRVRLNGSVAAAVMTEGGQRARAKLQSISITGGLLQLQHQLSAGDLLEVAFRTRSGAICGMAEMLQPTRKFQSACLQPFRFIALGDDDHRKLRMALDTALDRSFLDPVSEQLHTPPGFLEQETGKAQKQENQERERPRAGESEAGFVTLQSWELGSANPAARPAFVFLTLLTLPFCASSFFLFFLL